MYDGETYRLYTDNQDLRFAGYIMTAYQIQPTYRQLQAATLDMGVSLYFKIN